MQRYINDFSSMTQRELLQLCRAVQLKINIVTNINKSKEKNPTIYVSAGKGWGCSAVDSSPGLYRALFYPQHHHQGGKRQHRKSIWWNHDYSSETREEKSTSAWWGTACRPCSWWRGAEKACSPAKTRSLLCLLPLHKARCQAQISLWASEV